MNLLMFLFFLLSRFILNGGVIVIATSNAVVGMILYLPNSYGWVWLDLLESQCVNQSIVGQCVIVTICLCVCKGNCGERPDF